MVVYNESKQQQPLPKVSDSIRTRVQGNADYMGNREHYNLQSPTNSLLGNGLFDARPSKSSYGIYSGFDSVALGQILSNEGRRCGLTLVGCPLNVGKIRLIASLIG